MGTDTSRPIRQGGADLRALNGGMSDFDTWLAWGMDKGWISPVVCSTHDGPPTTEDEEASLWEGYDPCVPVCRVWGEAGPQP